MYLYSFDRFAGYDRVFFRENEGNFKTGDLLLFGTEYVLLLGKKTSFQEKYTYKRNSKNKPELVFSGILSRKTIELLHFIVGNYYSTYRASLKYFLNQDIDKLLSREIKIKKKKITEEKQELFLFPDLWTLMNIVDAKILNSSNTIFLNSKMSPKQKDITWWKIKIGIIHRIFCTHGEMFQDRKNIKKIHIYEPYKRYYKNQQDPRYFVPSVVERMGKIYF